MVDRAERIERGLEPLGETAPNALITVTDLEVVQSGASFKEGPPEVKVSEVMRREVATVLVKDPLTKVVELSAGQGFTALPVVDTGGRLLGMVSDNDLLAPGGMKVAVSLKRATDSDYVRELHESLGKSGAQCVRSMTSQVVTTTPIRF